MLEVIKLQGLLQERKQIENPVSIIRDRGEKVARPEGPEVSLEGSQGDRQMTGVGLC